MGVGSALVPCFPREEMENAHGERPAAIRRIRTVHSNLQSGEKKKKKRVSGARQKDKTKRREHVWAQVKAGAGGPAGLDGYIHITGRQPWALTGLDGTANSDLTVMSVWAEVLLVGQGGKRMRCDKGTARDDLALPVCSPPASYCNCLVLSK